jgi:hypothetical protein
MENPIQIPSICRLRPSLFRLTTSGGQRAGEAVCETHIGDRESAIAEEWVRVPDAHTHRLGRACRDRRLPEVDMMLYETLSQQPVQGTDAVSVMASGSLSWATWLIARLGGWSGYRSQFPPGIRTLSQGLKQFEAIFEGWSLAQDSCVCT